MKLVLFQNNRFKDIYILFMVEAYEELVSAE